MLNVGNVTLKKIGLGHKNYSSINILYFLIGTLKFKISLTVEFEVFTALFINIRVLWDMANQHGTIHKILQSFL